MNISKILRFSSLFYPFFGVNRLTDGWAHLELRALWKMMMHGEGNCVQDIN